MRIHEENDSNVSALARIKELEAKIAVLESSRSVFVQPKTVLAFVHSRYPFNFKDQLFLSGGAIAGISVGNGVVSGDTFIGSIEKVSSENAVAQTIFDPRARFAVRIGTKGIDALLVGGNVPRITLIPKNAEMYEGDIIYTAHPGVPYGLAIGAVVRPEISQDALFQESAVRVSLNPADLRVVTILISSVNDAF